MAMPSSQKVCLGPAQPGSLGSLRQEVPGMARFPRDNRISAIGYRGSQACKDSRSYPVALQSTARKGDLKSEGTACVYYQPRLYEPYVRRFGMARVNGQHAAIHSRLAAAPRGSLHSRPASSPPLQSGRGRTPAVLKAGGDLTLHQSYGIIAALSSIGSSSNPAALSSCFANAGLTPSRTHNRLIKVCSSSEQSGSAKLSTKSVAAAATVSTPPTENLLSRPDRPVHEEHLEPETAPSPPTLLPPPALDLQARQRKLEAATPKPPVQQPDDGSLVVLPRPSHPNIDTATSTSGSSNAAELKHQLDDMINKVVQAKQEKEVYPLLPDTSDDALAPFVPVSVTTQLASSDGAAATGGESGGMVPTGATDPEPAMTKAAAVVNELAEAAVRQAESGPASAPPVPPSRVPPVLSMVPSSRPLAVATMLSQDELVAQEEQDVHTGLIGSADVPAEQLRRVAAQAVERGAEPITSVGVAISGTIQDAISKLPPPNQNEPISVLASTLSSTGSNVSRVVQELPQRVQPTVDNATSAARDLYDSLPSAEEIKQLAPVAAVANAANRAGAVAADVVERLPSPEEVATTASAVAEAACKDAVAAAASLKETAAVVSEKAGEAAVVTGKHAVVVAGAVGDVGNAVSNAAADGAAATVGIVTDAAVAVAGTAAEQAEAASTIVAQTADSVAETASELRRRGFFARAGLGTPVGVALGALMGFLLAPGSAALVAGVAVGGAMGAALGLSSFPEPLPPPPPTPYTPPVAPYVVRGGDRR